MGCYSALSELLHYLSRKEHYCLGHRKKEAGTLLCLGLEPSAVIRWWAGCQCPGTPNGSAGMAPRVRLGGGGGGKANLTNSRRSMLRFDQLELVNVEV